MDDGKLSEFPINNEADLPSYMELILDTIKESLDTFIDQL